MYNETLPKAEITILIWSMIAIISKQPSDKTDQQI